MVSAELVTVGSSLQRRYTALSSHGHLGGDSDLQSSHLNTGTTFKNNQTMEQSLWEHPKPHPEVFFMYDIKAAAYFLLLTL